MYRYDVQSSRCVKFTYSGCGGNANRFETRAMCEVACQRYMTSQQLESKKEGEILVSPSSSRPISRCGFSSDILLYVTGSVCYESLAQGTCSEERLSYYFDGTLGVCKEFVYSGCGGNGNRFDTIAECRSECMSEEPRYRETTGNINGC